REPLRVGDGQPELLCERLHDVGLGEVAEPHHRLSKPFAWIAPRSQRVRDLLEREPRTLDEQLAETARGGAGDRAHRAAFLRGAGESERAHDGPRRGGRASASVETRHACARSKCGAILWRERWKMPLNRNGRRRVTTAPARARVERPGP